MDNFEPRHLRDVGDPNDSEDLDAVMVTVIMVALLAFLISMMYLAQYLVTKWCAHSAPVERSSHGVPRDVHPASATAPSLPFSSKIRQVYLETKIKSEVFCSVEDTDIESGSDQVDRSTITKNLNWAESLDTCSSVITDSDSNNLSSDEECTAKESHEHGDSSDVSLHDEGEDVQDGTFQCLICFEPYVNGDALVRHCSSKKSFHRSCIIQWLLRNDNCPYCRTPFLNLATKRIDEQ